MLSVQENVELKNGGTVNGGYIPNQGDGGDRPAPKVRLVFPVPPRNSFSRSVARAARSIEGVT